jgi:CheY-like chemotaxis protein
MVTKKVLIIDDEAIIRELLKNCLEDMAGWQVASATSGQEGLALAATSQPDAILLDMMMPQMSGLTFLCYQQEDPAIAQIPVVLLTAKGEFTAPAYRQALGLAGTIVKPFEPAQLIQQLTTMLGW